VSGLSPAVDAVALDPAWLQALEHQCTQAPVRPRVPLYLNDALIGSVLDDFCAGFAAQLRGGADGAPLDVLVREQRAGAPAWCLRGDGTVVLKRLATALRTLPASGVASLWRDEPLAVLDASGQRVASVERGAARVLGIATHAVHLVGTGRDGAAWIQQRALSKAVDPGIWDTLMGGMVPAADTLVQALERETWEEAGLRLTQLQALQWRGVFVMHKPSLPALGAQSGEAEGVGYVVERVDWYTAVVPESLQPRNQDGEVAQFSLVGRPCLLDMLYNHQFTTEAALVLARCHQAGLLAG